jgi:hypothetical protein
MTLPPLLASMGGELVTLAGWCAIFAKRLSRVDASQ